MPDDILITILSYLTVKEAAVTSHLSKRWRHLWRRTVHLDFEDNERREKILLQPKLPLPARNRYINWVNRVICHHNSPMIEDFLISFNLDKQSKGAMTKWTEFAISKNVQNLELNLMEDEDGFSDHVRNFVFPIKIFNKKTRLSFRQHSMNAPRMPSTMVREIKFLKTLILKCVNINDETIGEMMKSCPVLEHLHIYNSGHLVNLIIRGPALALRKLEIKQCLGIQSTDIRDSNLELFEYLGSGIPLILNNNPRLETVFIGAGYSGIENNLFQQISGRLPYLRNLRLNIYRPKNNMHLLSFPEMPKVKELTMIVGAWNDDSLLGLTCLAKACPNLQEFKIQLIWITPVFTAREIMHGMKHTHKHLEVGEIAGYFGRISDLELTLYLYDNSVALKKIVVRPAYPTMSRKPISSHILMRQRLARIAARLQLGHRISRGVELLIWMTPVIIAREVRHEIKHTQKHLEVVKIIGYYGRISDLELALCFYDNSVALKQIVVYPTYQVITQNPISKHLLIKGKSTLSAAQLQLELEYPVV